MERTLLKRCTAMCCTLVLVVSLSGCSLLSEDEHPLEIHLQSNFNGERVRVEIDGRVIFDGKVQTDHRLGLAEVIKLEKGEGKHRLWVDVIGSFSAERRFELEDTLYIGIEFYREAMPEAGIAQGVFFQLSKIPFGYD